MTTAVNKLYKALCITLHTYTHIVQRNIDSGETLQAADVFSSKKAFIGANARNLEHLVMPVIQKPEDKMFYESANLQHPRRHHEFFLRSRPYRGELPTVAGLLLYPDTPAKMETTSREAFCFRPIPHQETGKGSPYTQPESHPSHLASSRKTVRGNKDREVRGNEQEGNRDHMTSIALKNQQETRDMQSQYQKDFPPPSSCHRRRTPAFPQPDNIGINPAFRIDFSTVQRETYQGWPIMNPRYTGRPRAASSAQPDITSQW